MYLRKETEIQSTPLCRRFFLSEETHQVVTRLEWESRTMTLHEPNGAISSAIYCGSTTHRRVRPVTNRFTYPVYMAYVDLEELQQDRLQNWPIFSTRTAFAMTSLLKRNHLIHEAADCDLNTRVRDFVERHTGNRPTGRVRLLTKLRIMGVEFNPVSFYYIFNADDSNVEFVVAEVANFPWFEQHAYLLKPEAASLTAGVINHADLPSAAHLRKFDPVDKEFHVSPFMPIEHMRYHWMISHPRDMLRIFISLREDASSVRICHASLHTNRIEWSVYNLIKMQCIYPLHSLCVMIGILYEGAKFFRSGAVFFPHPTGATSFLSTAVDNVVSTVASVKSMVTSISSIRQRWRVAPA